MTPDATTGTTADTAPAPGARALAARRNGAKSRGPVTAAGKARSARNARRHGLCAAAPDDAAARAELAGLVAELEARYRPDGVLEHAALSQLAHALWRLARADAIEMALLVGGVEDGDGAAPAAGGAGLFRAAEGRRALGLLLRYRGAAERQLVRAERMLDALTAGRAAPDIDAMLAHLHAPPPGAAAPPDAPLQAAVAERARALLATLGPATERTQPPLNRHDRRRLAALERAMA